MIGKWLSLGVVVFALSGCVIPRDYDDDDYRPRERARSECAEEAYDLGYRRVEIETVRAQGRGEWDISIQARDRTGREMRLRCDYDARTRRARVTRVDR